MHPTAFFALLLTATTLAFPLAANDQGLDLSPVLDLLTGKKTQDPSKRAIAQIQPKAQIETGHSAVERETVGVWVDSEDVVDWVAGGVKPEV